MDESKIECYKCSIKVPISELDNHFLECQIQDDTGNQNEVQISDFITDPIPDQSDNFANETMDLDNWFCNECGKTFASEKSLKVSLFSPIPNSSQSYFGLH